MNHRCLSQVWLLSLVLLCVAACGDVEPSRPDASVSPDVACPAAWVAAARGGCGPAVVLCAPGGGAAPGACASVDLSRSHPVGDGGESFRLGPDGDIAGGWRWPGEPGGPPAPDWTPDAGAGAPDADWHPDAGIPTCPTGWTRTGDGLCDPALRACPAGAESLPGGQCTRTAEADCPAGPYADPGPEAMGAPVAYVSADAPASCVSRGSRTCPWRTITEALASNATWLLVGNGTYPERLEITDGRHIVGRCAARVTIEGADPERTVYVHGAGASLDLQGVTVTGAGVGIDVDDGASVRARSLRVSRATRNGVRLGGGSSVEASDIVIADTQRMDGLRGNGAAIGTGDTLRLARAALLRNSPNGAAAFGGEMTIRDSVVADTMAPPTRPDLAVGVYGEAGARVRVERTLVENNGVNGLLVQGLDGAAEMTATDVVVRGTLRVAPESAVRVTYGARLVAERLLVDGNLGRGVVVTQGRDESGNPGPIAYATVHDSVIRAPGSGPSTREQLGVQAFGAEVTLRGVRVVGATYIGVAAHGGDTSLTMEDGVVEGTRLNPAGGDNPFGCGVGVYDGARVTARRVLIADNAWAGIHADAPGVAQSGPPFLTVTDSVVRGNRFNRGRGSGGGLQTQHGAREGDRQRGSRRRGDRGAGEFGRLRDRGHDPRVVDPARRHEPRGGSEPACRTGRHGRGRRHTGARRPGRGRGARGQR